MVWEGTTSTRIRPPNFAQGISISYDSTVFQSVKFIDYKIAKPLEETILSTQVINEYKKTVLGNIVTTGVAVPVPFDNTPRGIWMVCTIKPPFKDTTIIISLSKDSSVSGQQNPFYVNFPVLTQNGRIKISLPSLQMSIGVPQLEAKNGDTLRVPILATGMKARYLIDSTPLQASLSFNASMLEPIAGTQAGSVQNGIRTVPFTFTPTPNSDTARATLLFRAAVGNDTVTTLIPRIEPQSGINYRTTAVNGSVRVLGNQAGGEQQRFFSKAARVRLVAVNPNPPSDQLTISLVVSEKTPVTISIVNVLGERLLRNEIMLESGIQDVPMSVRGLPSGVYLLTLQTETDIITRQIHILP